MINQNKILSTKVGDDIHFYVNGDEGRGIVVKMSNEYVMVAKENGDFQDIHINDTFFIKDIVVNKTWDLMEDNDRYEALMKIHAPSPRFISKPWAELPQEIKKLLTQKDDDDERGDVDAKDNTDEDTSGDLSSSGEYENKPAPRSYLADKPVKVNNKKNNGIEASHKKEDDMDSDWRGEKEGKTQETRDDDKEEDKKEDKEDKKEKKKININKAEDVEKEGHIQGTYSGKKIVRPETHQDAKGRKLGMARSAQAERGGQTFSGQSTQARLSPKDEPISRESSKDPKVGNPLKLAAWQLWLEDKALSGDANTKRKPKVNQTVTGGGAHNVTTESGGFKLNQSIAGQKEKPTIGLGSKITTRQLDTETGKETNTREASVEEERNTSRGTKPKQGEGAAFMQYFLEQQAKLKKPKTAAWQEFLDKSKQFAKIYGGKSKSDGFKKLKPVYEGDTKQAKKDHEHKWTESKTHPEIGDYCKTCGKTKKPMYTTVPLDKSDVEHGKYGGISTDTAYDIPKNTGYEERPHISLEEAGRLPRTTFNESGSELTVPKGGKKEIGTFKAPPAIQKKLDMVKELMGITDNGATNVVYGGSDNKYATALQNSTTKGRADNQVEDRE